MKDKKSNKQSEPITKAKKARLQKEAFLASEQNGKSTQTDTTATTDKPQVTTEVQEPMLLDVRERVKAVKSEDDGLVLIAESTTPEAKSWLCNPDSIPGVTHLSIDMDDGEIQIIERPLAPIRFIGWRTIDEIASEIGRPLTLDEVKHPVQTDGGLTHCAATNLLFQPLRWWKHCPRGLKEAVASGKQLHEVTDNVEWAGVYFYMEHLKELRAFSGCQFKPNGQLSMTSPLIMAAQAQARAIGSTSKHVWGKSKGTLVDILRRRKEQRLARQTASRGLEQRVLSAFGLPIDKTEPPINGLQFIDWTPKGGPSNGDGHQ